jgi:hypothetical protein
LKGNKKADKRDKPVMLSFSLLLKKLVSFFILIIICLVLMFSFWLTNFRNYDIILAEMTENLELSSISFFIIYIEISVLFYYSTFLNNFCFFIPFSHFSRLRNYCQEKMRFITKKTRRP